MPNRKEIFSQDSFGSALEWLGEQMTICSMKRTKMKI